MTRRILIFALLVGQCFGVGSVVQAVLGGSATGTSTATVTANFGSNTTNGNTLLLVAWMSVTSSNNANPFNVVPTTSGITWVESGLTGTLHDTTNHIVLGSLIYRILNAS